MSLRYRAIWSDDRSDLTDHAWTAFGAWASSRIPSLELPFEGRAEAGGAEVEVRRVRHDGHRAVEAALIERASGGGGRSTSLVAVEEASGSGWLWVDVDRRASERERPSADPAPRFVADLVRTGADPRVGSVRLEDDAVAMRGRPVAGLVRNPQRTLPLVVFTHDPAFDEAMTMARASATHRALAAAAEVFVLPKGEDEAFRSAIDPELAVGGGAARVYLPVRSSGGLRRDRNPLVEPGRMGLEPTIAARILAGLLLPSITARRPPPVWDEIRRALRGGPTGARTTDAEALRRAEDEIGRLRAERDDLRLQLELLEEDHFDTQADLLATEEELARIQAGFEHLWAAHGRGLARAGGPATSRGPSGSPRVSAAELDLADVAVPTSVRGAVELAVERLRGVVVHPSAPRDLDDLDAHPNAPAWASGIWRGLRALDAYARARFDGNFKSWCTNSGHPWAWSASDKKLALTESETVQENERLRRQRLLPVDERVDPSGAVHMWAHLKVAEGGGPIAPRIYFHDDTRGATGRVHVGFVGPHRHLENTRTN